MECTILSASLSKLPFVIYQVNLGEDMPYILDYPSRTSTMGGWIVRVQAFGESVGSGSIEKLQGIHWDGGGL